MTSKFFKSSIVASLVLLAAACASTGPTYQAASNNEGYGYRETAIEDNRYRVSYRAASAAEASNFALLRAAELTLAKGYDWFEVVSAETEQLADRNSGARVSIGGSTGGYGRSGVGIGIGVPVGGNRSGSSVRILEIIMGKGDKPEGAQYYDATKVRLSLGR